MQVTTGDATFTGNAAHGNARTQNGDQYGDRHISKQAVNQSTIRRLTQTDELNIYYQESTPRSIVALTPGPARSTLSLLANVASGLRSYADGIKLIRGAHRLSKDFARLSEALKVEHAILSSSLSILTSTRQAHCSSASASGCAAQDAPIPCAEGDGTLQDWIGFSYSPVRDQLVAIQNAANKFKVLLSLDDSGQVGYSLRFELSSIIH